jgi:hypothetical protein
MQSRIPAVTGSHCCLKISGFMSWLAYFALTPFSCTYLKKNYRKNDLCFFEDSRLMA